MSYPSKFHFDNIFRDTPMPCGDFLIYQLGEMYCTPSMEVKEHEQWCYEFTYVLSGKGTVYTSGKPVNVKQNDCIWTGISDTHRIVSDKNEPLRYAYIGYKPNSPETENLHLHMPPVNNRLITDASIRDYLIEMLSEISSNAPLAAHVIGALLKITVIKAFRHTTGSDATAYKIDKKDSTYIAYQTVRYIDANITKMNSLSELENELHYNYQYIARNFMKVMNMPISRYYANKKMEKAAQLLTDGASVTQTAETLGYSCIHSFSRAFENFYGVRPSEYVKSRKNT